MSRPRATSFEHAHRLYLRAFCDASAMFGEIQRLIDVAEEHASHAAELGTHLPRDVRDDVGLRRVRDGLVRLRQARDGLADE